MKLELSSLVKVRFGRRELDLVPFWSVWYFFISLVILFGFSILLEKVIYPRLEAEAMLPSMAWEAETLNINKQHRAQVTLTDHIYRTPGFPVSVAKTKPHRILVMGDSFVWGAALSNMNDIWWRQLQRELNRRGYDHVEVIASGDQGASTHNELDWAAQIVPRYHPDLVLWGYVTNDPDEGLVRNLWPGPDNSSFSSVSEFLGRYYPHIAYRLAAFRSKKQNIVNSNEANGYEYFQWETKILEGASFAKYQETLAQVKAHLEQWKVPSFFMTLPNRPTPDFYEPRYAPIQAAFQKAGIPFYNILPDFCRQYGGRPLLVFAATPTDGHPGPVSTHFFAVKAADILERDYASVLGPRNPHVPLGLPHINDWMPHYLDPVRTSKGTWVFDYPTDEADMLRMPLRRPFVQFNLETPVELVEIRVTGENLRKAVAYVTCVDPAQGFDDRKPHDLGLRRGSQETWLLQEPSRRHPINTVRLAANFWNPKQSHRLTLTLVQRGE